MKKQLLAHCQKINVPPVGYCFAVVLIFAGAFLAIGLQGAGRQDYAVFTLPMILLPMFWIGRIEDGSYFQKSSHLLQVLLVPLLFSFLGAGLGALIFCRN